LPEKQLNDGQGGQEGAEASYGCLAIDQEKDQTDGGEHPCGHFEEGDNWHEQANAARENGVLKVFFVEAFLALVVDELIDAGLEEEDGNHQRKKNTKQAKGREVEGFE